MKRVLVVVLALVMALSFTACNGGEETEALTAEEIVERVVEAQRDIKTAQYDMYMTMDMAVETGDESFTADVVMDMDYMVDLEKRAMKAVVDFDIEVPGEEGIAMDIEMYFIGDMMYMKMDYPMMGYPGMNSMWMKSEMPEGMWEQMNQIEPQLELLSTADVEVTGSQKVNGVNCYVVELTNLDAEQLWQLAMQQGSLTGQGMMPELEEALLKEVFRNFSMKQWIAKDTFLLAKAEITMSMELTPEAMGMPEEEGSMEMDIALTMLAFDYNQPVSIVVPPEAEEAVEMPFMMP